MSSTRRTCTWITLLLALPWMAAAETGYVIDRVEVGLYQSASFDSPILKLLPTGTQLEILSRQDELIQVREPGGLTGWIDQRYLMGAKPTRQLLNEAELELARLRNELEAARRLPAAPAADQVTDADINRLEEIRDNLQKQLAAERQRISELKGELANARRDAAAVTEEDPAIASDLLDAIRHVADSRHLLIILGVVFLIGLLLGVYLLDYIHRRRHGGFRI